MECDRKRPYRKQSWSEQSWPEQLWATLLRLGLVLVLLLGPADSAGAAPLPLLTPEILQQRLVGPGGDQAPRPTLDLRGFTIDLRPESPLRQPFYTLLSQQDWGDQAQVPTLDLSGARVLGDLDLQRLALAQPVYSDPPALSAITGGTAQLQQDRDRLVELDSLTRSWQLEPPPPPQVYLFLSPLVLVNTRFSGTVTGRNTFFVNPVLAQGAQFQQPLRLEAARFGQGIDMTAAQFRAPLAGHQAIFFGPARFEQSQFGAEVDLAGAEFRAEADFSQVRFAAGADFSRGQWEGRANFAHSQWGDKAMFLKNRFSAPLVITEARFSAPLILRQSRFDQAVILRGTQLDNTLDLGDALFQSGATLRVTGLEFNSDQGAIVGTPGQIGAVIALPTLAGNETLLRSLVRNFRQLEQISDANQIEYGGERLRLRDWGRQLTGINLNTASVDRLVGLGFSTDQAQAIDQRRQQQPLLTLDDLLSLDAIDLATYATVGDRIVVGAKLPPLEWLGLGLRWLGLGLVVVLSHDGTSVRLVLGLGLVAVALFGAQFWLVDRCRRRWPTPLLPPLGETLAMAVGTAGVLGLGLGWVLRVADYPGLSLGALGLLCGPLPLGLIGRLVWQGRYHDLMTESYLVEDGSQRQVRLLIARLPVIPRFPFFRDRYAPLLLDRRWNWLNYLDFSFNNWFKIGFNDLRLRDRAVPGLVTALVWYQWGLGVLYVVLLLWTFSRTIPGLNLLIYF